MQHPQQHRKLDQSFFSDIIALVNFINLTEGELLKPIVLHWHENEPRWKYKFRDAGNAICKYT